MMGVDQFFMSACKGLLLAAAGAAAVAAPAWAQPLPAAGHPGCYAKIAYPPVYRTVTTRAPGALVVSYRDIPAVIEHYKRQVLVAPARIERETIAPVYRTAWRWIETPGPVRHIASPPVYRTLTERRLISPAHLAWRPGGAAHGFAPGEGYDQGGGLQVRATGEVLCRVLVPARYAWTRRRVMISPGREITVQGPPRHVRVQDRVLVQPGRTVRHVIAAVYRTVDCTRIVRPAGRQRMVSPGPARLVSRHVMAAPQHYGWAPIVCAARPGPRRPAPPPPIRSYSGQSYGAALSPVQTYSAAAYDAPADRRAGHAYEPGEILAPTPGYPATPTPPLVPAPYDVGHPARR
jgi:hypothetical protein